MESLRSDSANLILGLRVNIWISLLCIVGAALVLLIGGVKRRPDDSDEPYRDGHRYVPAGAGAAADGEVGTSATTTAVESTESSESSGPSDSEPHDAETG